MSCGTEKKKNVKQRASRKPTKALIPKDVPGNVKEQTSPESSEKNASDTKEKIPKTSKRKTKQPADPVPARRYSAPRIHYQIPDNVVTRLTELDPDFSDYANHLAVAIKESSSPEDLEFTLPFYIASSLVENAAKKISPAFHELKDALKDVKLTVNTVYREDGTEID